MSLSIVDPRHAAAAGNGIADSIRGHLRLAGAAVFILLAGGGGWAVFTEISGAVIARGNIAVESQVKRIQHREGGIVRDILVREGQEVSAGDPLLRLDDTRAKSNRSIIANQLAELKARRTRLEAERDGLEQIAFPARDDSLTPETYAEIELTQSLLLSARRGGVRNRQEQLQDQIEQLEKQITGFEIRLGTKKGELELIVDELAGVRQLYEKKLVTKNRISLLRREKTRIEGEYSELQSQIAGVEETISERRSQLLQLDEDTRQDTLQELQEVVSQIAELELQHVTVLDELDRLEIRAPQSGYVHQLEVHTVGGVVPPGETILQIVPRDDLLVVDAQVAPSDIDQLHVGQEAQIRFPGLDHRKTPRLAARVQTVAADQTYDTAANERYYRVRLTIDEEELSRLNGQELVPGMPVEAFVTTENRSVLSYLTKPIVDQIAHAMRET